jgi:hypothetical protein
MNVYQKWRLWAKARGVSEERYARLYARLTLSPAAIRVWRGQ